MKGLTLWEPWASLIALGAKTIETRSWYTPDEECRMLAALYMEQVKKREVSA